MRWVAIFTDRQDSGDIRTAHMADHLDYLERNKGVIVIAGPIRPEPDAAPAGGLWIIEGETRADVEALIAQDPFKVHGLRASTTVYSWAAAPLFEDVFIGKRLS
jgi:uncharacterized protein YciI